MTFDPLLILAAIFAAMIACAALLGFLLGRITKRAKGPLFRFKLSDAQLALIAYEASRAFKAAHGNISLRSWNNVPRAQRLAMIDQITGYRRRPHAIATDSPELQLQAAIVALAS